MVPHIFPYLPIDPKQFPQLHQGSLVPGREHGGSVVEGGAARSAAGRAEPTGCGSGARLDGADGELSRLGMCHPKTWGLCTGVVR